MVKTPPELVPRYPKNDKEQKFCVEYLKDYNAKAAATRAGYSKEFIAERVYRLPRRLKPYIDKLEEQKTKQMVKHIAIEQSEVLHLVSLIARANIQDYVLVNEREVEVEGKKSVVRKVVQKPLEELTRDQAAVIDKVFTKPDGSIGYQLHDKNKALLLAMRHYGMLSERLIAEHIHKHLHLHADLREVPTEKLILLEKAFMEILGPQAAQVLGINNGTAEVAQENKPKNH